MGIISPGRASGSQQDGPGEVTEANALTALLNEFNGNIDGTNLKASLTLGTLLLTGSLTATNELAVSGAGTPRLSLRDTSAGADLKRSRLRNLSGKTRLDVMTDNDVTTSFTGLSLDHATGVPDFPQGFTGKRLDSPYFRAYRSSAASYTDGSTVIFNSEDADPNGWYDPATGKFQPTTAGRYRLSWRVTSNAVLTAGKYWVASVGLAEGQPCSQVGSALAPSSGGTVMLAFNGTTDFAQVSIQHDIGVAAAVATGTSSTWFEAERIGA
jgi:hypothetical protein